METLKSFILWCMDHPAAVTAAAVAVYPVVDVVLRLFVSDATVTKWETEGGKVVRMAAKVYRVIHPLLIKNR